MTGHTTMWGSRAMRLSSGSSQPKVAGHVSLVVPITLLQKVAHKHTQIHIVYMKNNIPTHASMHMRTCKGTAWLVKRAYSFMFHIRFKIKSNLIQLHITRSLLLDKLYFLFFFKRYMNKKKASTEIRFIDSATHGHAHVSMDVFVTISVACTHVFASPVSRRGVF